MAAQARISGWRREPDVPEVPEDFRFPTIWIDVPAGLIDANFSQKDDTHRSLPEVQGRILAVRWGDVRARCAAAKSPGKAAVTFICCGNPQSVHRFTRPTNAFSKKIENRGHAIALHFMHYNFCRVHQTLRVTPAMEAGITNHVWSIEELVSLLDRSDRIAA
jgi:hypothetical protein